MNNSQIEYDLSGANVLNKRILISSEKGPSDFIQNARYFSCLKNKEAYVIVKSPDDLWRLLDYVPGVDEIIKNREIEHDYLVSAESLSDYFPNLSFSPYVLPEKTTPALSFWERYQKKLKVMFCWEKENVELFEALKMPETELFRVGLDYPDKDTFYQDMSYLIEDYADISEVLVNADLVITGDNPTAHIAGAMGKSTWILLDKDDNQWPDKPKISLYPTMVLVRQDVEDWKEVFATMKESLTNVIRTSGQWS